jgi:hypothetical protein
VPRPLLVRVRAVEPGRLTLVVNYPVGADQWAFAGGINVSAEWAKDTPLADLKVDEAIEVELVAPKP